MGRVWPGFQDGGGRVVTGRGGNLGVSGQQRKIVMLNFEVDGKFWPGSPESGAEVRDQGTGLLWGCGPKV